MKIESDYLYIDFSFRHSHKKRKDRFSLLLCFKENVAGGLSTQQVILSLAPGEIASARGDFDAKLT